MREYYHCDGDGVYEAKATQVEKLELTGVDTLFERDGVQMDDIGSVGEASVANRS